MKPGRRSSSTRSVTWNRELRCLRGVLAIGIVSLGPVARSLLAVTVPALGGVPAGERACPPAALPGLLGNGTAPGLPLRFGVTGWWGAEEGWGSGSCGITACSDQVVIISSVSARTRAR